MLNFDSISVRGHKLLIFSKKTVTSKGLTKVNLSSKGANHLPLVYRPHINKELISAT